MKETLENEYLKISVLTKGAELCEIKSCKSGLDYLWNADPDIWSSHAPVLFPAIGAVKDGKVFYEEKEYALPRHGFVRNNEKVELLNKTDTDLHFFLGHDNATLAVFPFQFEFHISYRLQQNRLFVEHTVVNLGDTAMYFSLGGHPAFKCPIFDHENYSDYYLEFDVLETDVTWVLDDQGLVSSQSKPVLDNTRTLPLTHALFNTDALIFKHLKSKGVTLRSQKSTNSVRLDFADFPYLGIWAKPNGDFVCLEPWLGIADRTHTDQQLKHKEGIVELSSKASYKAMFSITIGEDQVQ